MERRLRSLPADVAIDTSEQPPQQVAQVVLTAWNEIPCRISDEGSRPSGRFSFSRLAVFNRCRLAYKLRYVDGLLEASESWRTLLGRLVHEALAWAYWQREISQTPSAEALVGWFREQVRLNDTTFIGPEAKARHSEVENKGIALLRFHHASVLAVDRLTTLAVEKEFAFELDPGVLFVGAIDRVARGRLGELVIIDYKTSMRGPVRVPELPDLLQLEGYSLAAMLLNQADVVEARRHFVADGQEETLVVGKDDRSRVRSALLRWISVTHACQSLPPMPSKVCSWCGYHSLCPRPGVPFEGGVPTSSNRGIFKLSPRPAT